MSAHIRFLIEGARDDVKAPSPANIHDRSEIAQGESIFAAFRQRVSPTDSADLLYAVLQRLENKPWARLGFQRACQKLIAGAPK